MSGLFFARRLRFVADYPRTEEGFLQALADREYARSEGDLKAEAKAALALSTLVKWVHSDNHEPPFVRSFSLANEALALSRSCGDRHGEARALLLGVQLLDTDGNLKRQQEAEAIARELGDKNLLGQALAAQGRTVGMRDSAEALVRLRKALALFEETGDADRQATCHFSLSIHLEDRADKIQHSLEAFRLYRLIGDREEAGRALMMSMIAAETDEEKTALEPAFLLALDDARQSQNPTHIKRMLTQLARIASANGDLEEAKAYVAEAESFHDPSELDPVAQWEMEVSFTKLLLAACVKNGQVQAAKEFRRSLNRLNKSKPQE